jgi:NAD(P)-dependent dehydrogenase (short-subunit alcohol dehydrogenase family)/acyl dehydratase
MRFDGRVAIVTGAGGGLGKTYALLLASLGAKVVVNDLGGSATGEGAGQRAADSVVAEIRAAGGEAMANYDSVEQGELVVKTAIEAFGRVDIVINNAGILRDVSFARMKDADWDIILRVHLTGAYKVTKAAWPYMREQGYGRVVMTSSAAGLYGNVGQANYAAAKIGLHGFAQTLAKEGAAKNIKVNTIAPVAGSRLTATVLPQDLVDALKPEYVAPLVAYLCHEACEESGAAYELGAGWYSRVRWQRSEGASVPSRGGAYLPTIEDVAARWAKINSFESGQPSYPTSPQDSFGPIMANLSEASSSRAAGAAAVEPGAVDPDRVLAHRFEPVTSSFSEKDVSLYALGVGAEDLPRVYELSPEFEALPSFAVLFMNSVLGQVGAGIDGISFNPMMLLHGEQHVELPSGALPTSGRVTTSAKVKAILEKPGKGCVLVVEATTVDASSGAVLCVNEAKLFIRGVGKFDSRGQAEAPAAPEPPASAKPDRVVSHKTLPSQALLYRLTGDTNPLHADPAMAAMGGFDRPILHGLCTFGVATRAILQAYPGESIKTLHCRFSKPVYPGETIQTEMWRQGPSRVLFRCTVPERQNTVVLTAAYADFAAKAKM